MSHHRRQQRYLVERLDNGVFRIHDKRTRKSRDYYAAEFVYGCIDYCETTAKYPGYVHSEIWRLAE